MRPLNHSGQMELPPIFTGEFDVRIAPATATLAACVVLSTTRVDVNGVVRRRLGARKASFAPMDLAVGETGMEYGGITPIGLPASWPVLVDAAVVDDRSRRERSVSQRHSVHAGWMT